MRLAILAIPGFPTIDGVVLERELLESIAGPDDEIVWADADALHGVLAGRPDVVLTPYGSAFPEGAWPAFHGFLASGGCWVNLGGSPLLQPVRQNRDGSWCVETPRTSLSKELLINQSFPCDLEHAKQTMRVTWHGELRGGDYELGEVLRAWSLQVRFTSQKDHPEEGGSSGPREATMRALCAIEHGAQRAAAPLVLIDRLLGSCAGGRWVFLNAKLAQPPSAQLVRKLVQTAAAGPVELTVRPSFACYYGGERAALTARVKAHRLKGQGMLQVSVRRDDNQLATITRPVRLSDAPVCLNLPLSMLPDIRPGLYHVSAALVGETGESVAEVETGFWGYDEALLRAGVPLEMGADYFIRNGEPFPLAGTTYMSGDAHRRFLFEPNPAVWDVDFAAMRAAGVNIVRTGFWTAFKHAMLDSGVVDEGVLRAFTAFLLTARRYDIPVIFNFFAFLPEAWGGANPYLDPQSVAAQTEVIAAFTHRFAMVNDLSWDLINEPSFSSPSQVWRTRPNYDIHETAAWNEWLHRRESDFTDEERRALNPNAVWRDRWRLSPSAPLEMPALADFADLNIFQGTHPLRVLDYRLFAQEAFSGWVRRLTDVIRANGNEKQPVTVGQDEGGSADRPNPHFLADSVDYTCIHSWWLNDDLLWDSLITKTPGKPNVIQETGIMFLEQIDGGYRRSPRVAANLLAQKLALSLAGGCAGAIQWLWNTNIYMDSDNEVGIGFLRADGVAKPELEVFQGFAGFVRDNRARLSGRKPAPVCVVVPHGVMFSARDTAIEATRRCIRALEYRFGRAVRTAGEFYPERIGDAEYVVVPSPMVLSQSCWDALIACAEAGATVCVSGPVDRDLYWRRVERLAPLGLKSTLRPVTGHEAYRDEQGSVQWIRFGRSAQEGVDRAIVDGADGPTVRTVPVGAGKLIYCPVPVELSLNGAEDWLYAHMLGTDPVADPGMLRHRQTFETGDLLILVNESSEDQRVDGVADITVPAGGAGLVFLDRDSDAVRESWIAGMPERK